MSADAVSDAKCSSNEPAKNPAKYEEIHEPLEKGRVARRPLWLIAKHENGRTAVFTIHPDSDRETLPIFTGRRRDSMVSL